MQSTSHAMNLDAAALKQHTQEWAKLGGTMERSLSFVSSVTTLQRSDSTQDFLEEEPSWEFFEQEGESEEIECGGSSRYVLYCCEHEVCESKYEEVPFPYIRRNGRVVEEPSVELKAKSKAYGPNKLRASAPLGNSLEAKFKWRQQYDEEEAPSKFKRAVAFIISHLQPVPTASDFTPY
mmetsp:Transcript_49630/g.130566  ORF Transcript_49630/g.130566 Transcript_49630/m.130566 type:complete len:179 (-) Transcript_49630:31-567(-)|eukprot:CAMPEP_0113687078 /NCGR_PEP_ID=MMETSP0038_2-20120614/15697_1 /TAXON_ID=2898 /ORGANISM="Cryptomonas paramecium" /LENGTH=178 /DNA_ID=CAMNT_0000607575 /DNA_START=32 /DNA_END=568 /DNA_ORIENTATION=- /assembly_acc=CAM_ASM_000170